MNLGRETKRAVSSRHYNTGSDHSTKLSTLKSRIKTNYDKANAERRKISKESDESKCRKIKDITREQNIGRKFSSFQQSGHTLDNEKDNDNEQRKGQFNSSTSSIAIIEKLDESKNHIKEHCNEHIQQILNKRSYSLDGNENSVSSTLLRKNARRKSYAITNEIFPFSSTINKVIPNINATTTNYSSARRPCIQQIKENANDGISSTYNSITSRQTVIR